MHSFRIRRIAHVVSAIVSSVVLIACCRYIDFQNHIEQYENYTVGDLIEELYFSNDNAELHRIKLVQTDECYVLFVPFEMEAGFYAYFDSFDKLIIDDICSMSKGNAFPHLSEECEYLVHLRGWNGTEYSVKLRVYYGNGCQSLYVKTESGSIEHVNEDKSVKEKICFLAVTPDNQMTGEGSGNIAARGMSSFSEDQKSYNFKLDKSQNLYGIDACTKWCLLANTDVTEQLKNKLVFDMARNIGMKYSPESEFVNLYIDGIYNGLYLLTQRPDVGGSVEIHDLEHDNKKLNNNDISEYYDDSDGTERAALIYETSPNNISGGYLLEQCARYDDEVNVFSLGGSNPNIYVNHIVVKAPDVMTEDEILYIASYVNEAIDALMSDNSGKCWDYFDIESWADMYILEDFAVEWDLGFDSFKFYKEENDPLLYAGPVWDFDLAFGDVFWGHYPQMLLQTNWVIDGREGWLRQMHSNPLFEETVQNKYREFSTMLAEYMNNEYRANVDKIKNSQEMTEVRWASTCSDYSKATDSLYSWVIKRDLFYNNLLDYSEEFCRITFAFRETSFSYYAKKGEKLGFLPTEEYGEFGTSQDDTPIAWNDESGEPVTADTVIESDKIFVAVY